MLFRTDTSGTKFFPPVNGWEDKKFIVIYKTEQPKNETINEKSSVKLKESKANGNKKESGKSNFF